MHKKYLLLLSIMAGLINNALADDAVSMKTAGTNPTVKKPSVHMTCALGINATLTVSALDNCWNNRETNYTQTIITNYLETYPSLPQDYAINWRIARLVFFIGNYSAAAKSYTTSLRGQKLFMYGANAGKAAMTLKPNQVEGAFWYAVNLGGYDVAKGGLSGLSDRKKWLDAVNTANQNDPTYYYYGSDRLLAVYYQVLPSMFGGSKDKALQYLNDATTKSPEFKLNWITLGQYYLSTKNYKMALNNCQKGLNMPDIDGKYENLKYNKDAKDCINKAQSHLN